MNDVKSKGGFARFLRFLVVGSIGFGLDAGLLVLLMRFGVSPFLARAVSIPVAAFVTWRLNRVMTFGASGDHQVHEGLRYASVVATASIVNYLIYAGLVLLLGPGLVLLALLIAASLSMFVSYFGFAYFAFSGRQKASVALTPANTKT